MADDRLSTFLASFPTQHYCTTNKSAFSDSLLPPSKGVLQFWAPVKTSSGRLVLSTSYQPFTFEYLHPLRHKYRLCSMKYQYCTDGNNTEDPMIISGLVATAFVNRCPVVVVDMMVHQGNPLVDFALESGLSSSILMPVYASTPSLAGSNSISFVGVVECSVKRIGLLNFNTLKRAGLSTDEVQDSQPYKSIRGLKHVTDEIEEALETVCESHDIPLDQIWVVYENENHVPVSSFVDDSQTKRTSAVMLIGYRDFYDELKLLAPLTDYYENCDMHPLKIGEGLVGKTLQTYEPHFCRNTYKLMSNNGLLAVLYANTRTSCLVICLRSMETGDLDYAFEFLWHPNRDYFVLMESLLLTLKSCLPSFKFASGAQLGDELGVIDVENSTGSGIGFFKTLEQNRLPQWKKCGNGVGISEWKGPKFLKQKLSDLTENHMDSNQVTSTNIKWKTYPDDDVEDVQDDLLLATTYGEKFKVFHHLTSSTIADVKKKVEEEFNLDPGTYGMEVQYFEGSWQGLNSDSDFETCVLVWESDKMIPINVHVVPSTVEKSGYAAQNTVEKEFL